MIFTTDPASAQGSGVARPASAQGYGVARPASAQGYGEAKEKWNVTHSIIAVELSIVVALAWWFTTPSAFVVISNITKTFIY
jgi:hypothetical protein